MANPPPKGNNGRPRHSWMCPNHVDAELKALDSSVKTSRRVDTGDAKTHKIRRPKNARIVDTALRRGFINNGLIEIENEASDDDKMEDEGVGIIYRVPEKGIKLDFIDRVKRYVLNDSDCPSFPRPYSSFAG